MKKREAAGAEGKTKKMEESIIAEGKKQQQEITIRWNEKGKEEYQKAMLQNWKEAEEPGDIDKRWQNLQDNIWRAAEESKMVRDKENRETGEEEWFDTECKKQRKEMWTKLNNAVKINATKEEIGDWKKERKKRNALHEEKRKKWTEKVEKSVNTKEFWKAIDRFRPRKASKEQTIKREEWEDHFRKLLSTEEKEDWKIKPEWNSEAEGEEEGEQDEADERLSREILYEEMAKILNPSALT